MNCDEIRDNLIDLVYDELPADERAAVEAHLADCPHCRAEFEALQFARSAVAESLTGEPQAGRFVVDAAAGAGKAPLKLPLRASWWIRPMAAAAMAAMVLLGVWIFHDTSAPPLIAQKPGPAEISKVGVSLTILSQPEGWANPPTAMQQIGARTTQQEVQVPYIIDDGQSYQVQLGTEFINAPPSWGGRPVWQGMALVRDQRVVRRLGKGVTSIAFADVPMGILPDTVRLQGLDRPHALSILEQNYQYDLASASAVLRKHIDKPVTATFKDGRSVTGTLLSFDARTLVIRPNGAGPRNLTRKELRGITFAKLPKGLLSRPTLVWDLDNRGPTKQKFEVAYLTRGLTWRADYVLKLRPGWESQPSAKPQAAAAEGDGDRTDDADVSSIRNPESSIVDTCDLVGYATVNNFSGVSYADAQLKLMAGDVNLIKPPQVVVYSGSGMLDSAGINWARPAMTEKSFFEYHLYTVTRPTTIRSAETKQIEMVSGGGLKLTRGYVYNPNVNPTAARVVSELMNSEENGLGKPLPKGVIRLYAPDPEGVRTFVAKTAIDHTPKDEKIRLPWGYAFDIACTAKQTEQGRRGDDHSATWKYQIRNHKDYDVTVTVLVHVPPSTYEAACEGWRWHVREVGIVEIDVPVKSNTAADVTFAYKWNPKAGGGLKSPFGERE